MTKVRVRGPRLPMAARLVEAHERDPAVRAGRRGHHRPVQDDCEAEGRGSRRDGGSPAGRTWVTGSHRGASEWRGIARFDVLAPRRSESFPAAGGIAAGIIGRMPALSRADVEHVAYLARLGLSDDELTRLEGQLNHILEQYARLAELDTEHIPPTAQTIELENILRDDVVTPSLPVEEVLRNASESAGGFVVVPPILAE